MAARKPRSCPSNSVLSSLQQFFWIASAACATFGVFGLPWWLPSATPAMSESYALGFNNRVAVLSLWSAIGAATAAQILRPKPSRAIGWLARKPTFRPTIKKAPTEYLILAACTLVWTHVLWAWGSSLVDPAFADSRGILYGIDLTALGQIPYRDFVFNYGPIHLYAPYGLSWASGGDLSFEWAYLSVLMCVAAGGFIAIFLFMRSLRMPMSARPAALLMVLLSCAVFQTSTAHMPLRFVCVPTGLSILHAFVHAPARSRVLAIGVPAVAASLFVTACLALSPEMGIAAIISLSVYASAQAWLRRQWMLAAGCAIGGMAAFAATLFVFPQYLVTVFAFAGGFGNLPVYPNPQNLLAVAIHVFVLSSLVSSALRHPQDHRSPLALGIASCAGILIVAAFGRAAPGHVFFNSMTSMMVMWAAIARRGRGLRIIWPVVYVCVEIVLLQISHWWTFYGTCATAVALRRFYDAHPQVVAEWREQWDARRAKHPLGNRLHWSSVLPYPTGLDELSARGHIMLTGGAEWNLWIGRYLLLQDETPRDFFTPWLISACTPEQIDRRLGELRVAKFLLVPEGDFVGAETSMDKAAYEQHIDRWLTVTMAFPVRSKVRREPYWPEAIQIRTLRDDYKTLGRFQFFMYMPFMVLERNVEP